MKFHQPKNRGWAWYRRQVLIWSVVAASGAGTAYVGEAWVESREAAQLTRGALFASVQGRRVRYELSSGSPQLPLVAFIPGWSAGMDLGDAILNRVGAPVLSYDPCGAAFSEAPPTGCDANGYVLELAELLKQVTDGRRVVPVGYSISSIAAREFLEQHRSQVAGLILIDPYLPEVQVRASPTQAKATHKLFHSFTLRLYLKAMFGALRLQQYLSEPSAIGPIEKRVQAIDVNARHWHVVWKNRVAIDRAKPEPLSPGRWGALPLLIVLTDKSSEGQVFEVVEQFAKQTSRGKIVIVKGKHGRLLDDPSCNGPVIEAIRDFVSTLQR